MCGAEQDFAYFSSSPVAQYPGQVNKPAKATAVPAGARSQRSRMSRQLPVSPSVIRALIRCKVHDRADGRRVAFLDYDGDGLLDLYFVNGARVNDPMQPGAVPDKSDPRYWNRLYRNTGSGTFLDVTEKAHVRGQEYGMGVAVADYDNDGHPDLYVTSFGRNALYRNRGDGTFEDATDRAGVGAEGWSTGAAFLDYDRDGLLDLIVTRYVEWDFQHNPWCGPEQQKMRGYCHPNAFPFMSHRLYRNKGDGTFADVSNSSGIAQHPGKGLGVAVHDFDRDGWPDIFVANDSVAQQLFHNLHNGKFEEIAVGSGIAYNGNGASFAGMGADFSDYNNDGWPDIVVDALSLQSYVVFRNTRGEFENVSEESGLYRYTLAHSGWGIKFVDIDNDGWRDIFVAQGHVLDTITIDYPNIAYKQKLLLLHSIRGKFVDASDAAGATFRIPLAARGAAFGDFNNDGSCDVALNINDGPAILLRGGDNRNHWIAIDTTGNRSNRDGIGTSVRIITESGAEQFGYVSTASSYLSASDKRLHFGLGSDARIREIELKWPSGIVQRLTNVSADRVLKVKEPGN